MIKIGLVIISIFFLFGGVCIVQGSETHSKAEDNKLKSCPASPNCVSSQSSDAGKAIAPLIYQDNRAEARARLKRILSGMKRVKIVAENEDYLHAEAISLIFRFVDDIEFYFPAAKKIIHVRSASRDGYYDLGVNRKRVEIIRKRFAEKL